MSTCAGNSHFRSHVYCEARVIWAVVIWQEVVWAFMCRWARKPRWSWRMAMLSVCMFTDEVEQACAEERLQHRVKIYGVSSGHPPAELVLDYQAAAVHDCCLCPQQTCFILNLVFHFFNCHWSMHITLYKSHFPLLLHYSLSYLIPSCLIV